MGKITLIHPVPIVRIRAALSDELIICEAIKQLTYDPANLVAEYDIKITEIGWFLYPLDQIAPKEVFNAVAAALPERCDCTYVVWRKDHLTAHICTWTWIDRDEKLSEEV